MERQSQQPSLLEKVMCQSHWEYIVWRMETSQFKVAMRFPVSRVKYTHTHTTCPSRQTLPLSTLDHASYLACLEPSLEVIVSHKLDSNTSQRKELYTTLAWYKRPLQICHLFNNVTSVIRKKREKLHHLLRSLPAFLLSSSIHIHFLF